MDGKRQTRAWAMYDWAGSAYLTCVATALLPAYFAAVVAPGGQVVGHATIPAASLWGYAVSVSAALVFVLAPVLGAMADKSRARGRYLLACCLSGVAAVWLLSLAGPGDTFYTLGLFVAAHVAYSAGNAFYDAYLPQIAPASRRDQVSSLGYAFGYAGGGLQLALALALVTFHERLGLDARAGVAWAMAFAGGWWLCFGVWSIRGLPAPRRAPAVAEHPGRAALAGVADAVAAFRLAMADKPLRTFFLAFFLYNDAIQTVISMATIYGKDELRLSDEVLMLTLLAIQGVALGGAFLFSRLARALGGKGALMLAVAAWTGLAVAARFIDSAGQYFTLGLGIGLALGGSQALSRSVFSRLVPPGGGAVYFGFYSVLVKLSAILGPLVFALVRQATGSSRPAVLALVVFFIAGLALLAFVRVPDDAKAL